MTFQKPNDLKRVAVHSALAVVLLAAAGGCKKDEPAKGDPLTPVVASIKSRAASAVVVPLRVPIPGFPEQAACPTTGPLGELWPQVRELLDDVDAAALEQAGQVTFGSSVPPAPVARLVERAEPFGAALLAQGGCALDRFVLSANGTNAIEPLDVLVGLRLTKVLMAATALRAAGERGGQELARQWATIPLLGDDLAHRSGLIGAMAAAGVWGVWVDATLDRAQPLWTAPESREVLSRVLGEVIARVPELSDLLRAESLGTAAGVVGVVTGDEALARFASWVPDDARAQLSSTDRDAVALVVPAYLTAMDQRIESLAGASDLADARERIRRFAGGDGGPARGPLAELQDASTVVKLSGRYIEAIARLQGLQRALGAFPTACQQDPGGVSEVAAQGVTARWTRTDDSLSLSVRLGDDELLSRSFDRAKVCPP